MRYLTADFLKGMRQAGGRKHNYNAAQQLQSFKQYHTATALSLKIINCSNLKLPVVSLKTEAVTNLLAIISSNNILKG